MREALDQKPTVIEEEKSLPMPDTTARQSIIVSEIVEYLSSHDGPDDNGRAHPTRQRVQARDLEQALKILQCRGACLGLRPYHFPGTLNLYTESTFVDEVLCKKITHLLSAKYDNDLSKMLKEVRQEDLISPLQDQLGGRSFQISMSRISEIFSGRPYHILMHYLSIAGLADRFPGLKPYHMAQVGVITPEMADEILKKKGDYLLSTKYGGKIDRMLQEVTQDDLESSFPDKVGEYSFEVSMGAIMARFAGSPYPMMVRYLQLTGQERLADGFKPYHMGNTTKGIFDETALIDEVVRKRIDPILRDQYGGNLAFMIAEADQDTLFQPFTDQVGDYSFTISRNVLSRQFNDSPYLLMMHYIRIACREEEFTGLKPYHMRRPGNGTFTSEENINEVLKKKVENLLAERYEGSLNRMLAEVTIDELKEPFLDRVGAQSFEVKMASVVKAFSGSPYQIMMRYLEITGQDALFPGFKSYHMAKACNNSYDDPITINEVLKKKIEHLLATKYGGFLSRMIREVNQEEMLSSFQDKVGEYSFEVSMSRIGTIFSGRPYLMLMRYLEITGQVDKFPGLQCYHMAHVGNDTFASSAETRDQVLCKKVDQLLTYKYAGDVGRMLREINQNDLLATMFDQVGIYSFEVSLAGVGDAFNCSPFEMLKRWATIKKRDFPYTRECFIGSPETRRRRMSGELSSYDLTTVRRSDGSYDLSVFGVRRFNSHDKRAVRELCVEVTEQTLGDTSIAYLGLEAAYFDSLRLIRERLNLSVEDSVIVEQDSRTFEIMQRTVGILLNGEGAALRQVELRNASLDSEIPKLAKQNKGFNYVNLDYLGHLSTGKESDIRNLFELGLFKDEALLFVTLSDDALARDRAERAGYRDSQSMALQRIVFDLAKSHGFSCQLLFDLPYVGGTELATRKSPMIVLGFKLAK